MHAEIVVDSATATLHVVDLASRYGSSVNGAKLQGNVPFPVENGAVARFGVGTARIRFTRRSYTYCTTRLEKAEKDKLKRCAKITGGRIVTQVEHATHVVANKVAATVKMLTALVVPLKTVRAEWLNFAEGSNAAEPIPKEEDFAPAPSDDVKVYDPARSCSALLAPYTIFLLNQYDIQYAAICRACGATLVDCAKEEEEKGVSALDLITQHVQQQQNNSNNTNNEAHKYCLFFDESRGIECDKILMNECREALNNGNNNISKEEFTLHWLTAGKLAASIITLAAPVLFQDPPKASKVPGGGASQSQNSAMTAGGHSHQQRMMLASQSQSQFPFSPLAISSRAVVPQAALIPPFVSAVPPAQAAVVHAVHRNVSEQRALPPLPPSATLFAKQASVAAAAVGVTRIDSTRTIAGTLMEHTLAETAIGGAAVVVPLVSADRRMAVVKEEPQEVVAVPVPIAAAKTKTATSTAIVNKKRGREEEPEPEAVITSITSAKASGAAANKDYPEESEDAFFQETKPPQTLSAATATTVMPAHKRAKPSAFTAVTASPSSSPVTSPRSINPNTNNTSVAGRGSSRKDDMDVSVTVPIAFKATTISTIAVPSLSAATTSSTSSSTTTNPSRRSTTSTNYNYRNQDDQQEGDWVEALRGADRTLAVHLKQTQVAREKQQHGKDSDAHDEAHDSEADEPVRRLPAACVIEKADLIGAFIGDHSEPRRIFNGSQASASSSASSATANVRNVKVFRKNKICSVGVRERMSFTHKQLVLPKESERQIQLWLEADARDELERYADHMMSEKFAATSKRTALK
eukprot:gene12958-14950_t